MSKRKKQKTTGVKFDQAKVDLSLLPREPLEEIARVMMFGAKKYSRNNWRGGITINRLIAAALRHIHLANDGETYDAETNTLHFANAATNMMFAIWMIRNRPDLDDRWAPTKEKQNERKRKKRKE